MTNSEYQDYWRPNRWIGLLSVTITDLLIDAVDNVVNGVSDFIGGIFESGS